MEVLLVDDRPLANEIFGALASKVFKGAKVRVAQDLGVALRTLQRPVDLVMLDLGLPGCSGTQALERFRAAFPAVPILVISASEDWDLIQRCLDSGASGYIAKTASLQVIAAAMKAVAGGNIYMPQGISLRTH